ncbi:hypothetical protein GA0074696_1482 [Micromonospora purpureochromogenes]|uniref:Uncharacterized protein n=1 Tax=Micromonospora purpureochromogenes TaxID=47872 RepID=A0A1C4VYT2_9ACTN|nr:hypothetical protein [Micromonospora purpureochromogenes]SCE89005.1 hypothetical protein GA0074696_1482 [Micromonospora purpureochromogenes]
MTWSDDYIWRTYFAGRRPTAAAGTWLLADEDERWVRLDLGVREAGPARDHGSPDRYAFGDALLVDHDGRGFALLTFDGSPDEGWTNRFDRCAS